MMAYLIGEGNETKYPAIVLYTILPTKYAGIIFISYTLLNYKHNF